MIEQTGGKLNHLDKLLPEGLLVDAAWLTEHGFTGNLRSHYVATGRLEQPARRVYRRPREKLSWEQVVISLETILLRNPLTVGGRTALELQGFAHFLKGSQREVHLYGPKPPPTWLYKLPLKVNFLYHNDRTLLRSESVHLGTTSLAFNVARTKLAQAGAD